MIRRSPLARPAPVGARVPADPALFATLVASRPSRERRSGVLASATSVVLHVGGVALLVWATMGIGEAVEPREPMIVLLPPRSPAPTPAPPPPAPVDAAPPVPAPDVPRGSVRIEPPAIVPPEILPPSTDVPFDATDYTSGLPEGDPDGESDASVSADDIEAGPVFTPMTTRPAIRNRDEVGRALQRFYPPLLRDAGIGGTVVVWILIDEEGHVVRIQVHQSSGHAGLDDAALRVGEVIEFTPALNRDRAVPVWIQWPIAFRASR